MDSNLLLKSVTEILEDKKAKDIEVIDIKELTTIADYFVICSGTSMRHIKSLTDDLKEGLLGLGFEGIRIEGYDTANWVLVDLGDVIVHIFQQEYRELYDIERIWSDGILFRQ